MTNSSNPTWRSGSVTEPKIKQERARKTRNKILLTARKIFAKQGFHGTSMDAVADAAKANKERIYAYFGSKKKLFEVCLVDAFSEANRMDAGLEAAIAGDPRKLTRAALENYFEIHCRYPDFQRLLAWANLEPGPFHNALQDIKEESFTYLRKIYRKGQESGIFPDAVSFESYIFSLLAISYFYYSNRKTLSGSLNPQLFTAEGRERLIRECTTLIEGI